MQVSGSVFRAWVARDNWGDKITDHFEFRCPMLSLLRNI